MSKWIEKTLGEVTSYLAKGIPPKYVDELSEDVIYVLNQKCNRNFVISYEPARMHDLSKKKVGEEKMLRPGDVLINSTGEGTAGRIAQIWDIPHPTTTDGHMITIRPTMDVDPLFYGYAVKAYQKQIETLAEGSTGQTELNKTRLQNEIIIRFPENKEEQYNIAVFLENIDKKIAVNEKINKNLEEQLGALYKENIRDSELPSREITLDELCNIFTGRKNANQNDEDGQYMFFTCGEKSLRINSYIYDGPAIIISGNGSYTGRTLFYNGKFDLYQRTYACTLKEGVEQEYIFGLYAILKIELNKKITGGTRGSSIPYIVMNDLAKFEFNINDDVFMEFSKQSKAILDSIQHNVSENEQLANLRDSLLPKLMLGELDVSEFEI